MWQLVVGKRELAPPQRNLRLFFYAESRRQPPASLRFAESGAATGLVRASVWAGIVRTARSGLTCSFSPLRVVCGGGLLLPLQSLRLPVALQGPLLLLARWEVRLTSFRELHTEMPLSAALSRKRPWSDCASECFSTHKRKKRRKRNATSAFILTTAPSSTSSLPSLHFTQCRNAVENHSSVCHRAGIRPASETADFNLYLNPLGPRVQTQTKLLGLCRERVRLKSLFSYSAPWGDVIYEEKEFLKGDVKVQRFTLLEVDLCWRGILEDQYSTKFSFHPSAGQHH